MRGVSSLVVGLLLALAVTGFLATAVRWARQRAESLESLSGDLKPSYTTVSAYGLPDRMVIANFGPREVSVGLLRDDWTTCGTLVVPPRSAVVSPCPARWVAVRERLIGVVRVA